MKINFECHDLRDLPEAAEILLSGFVSERVFAFYGEMGAGKTTFISALVKELGSKDAVQSPTYALVNEYHTLKNEVIYHFDFYRLRDEQEAFESGMVDLIDSGAYCFMEWPDKITGLLPNRFVKVNIRRVNEVRIISMELSA